MAPDNAASADDERSGPRVPCGPKPSAAPAPPRPLQAKCHFFKNDDFNQVLTELPAKGSVAKTKSEPALGRRAAAGLPCGAAACPRAHKPEAAVLGRNARAVRASPPPPPPACPACLCLLASPAAYSAARAAHSVQSPSLLARHARPWRSWWSCWRRG